MNDINNIVSYDIFISYRRSGGDMLAKLIYEFLRQKRYSVFFDHESLTAGVFGDKLITTVKQTKDVIVVLTNNCLQRCKNPDDWMFREIETSLKSNKNIILVFSDDFCMPDQKEINTYPEEIQKLLDYQGYHITIEHFNKTMEKICSELLSAPFSISESEIKPVVDYLLGGGVETLSKDEQHSLFNQLLACRYGKTMADVMDSFIETTTENYTSIRTRFRYEIEIHPDFSFKVIDSDDYFRLTENFSFEKHFFNEIEQDVFWIAFIRDLDKLDDSLRDESFFFSENLLIKDVDFNKILSLSEEEKTEFFNKKMRVKVNINGEILHPESIRFDDAGIFAQYVPTITNNTGNILDVKIMFSIPHRKTASYFFVSINDPTYNPYIRFTYPEDETEVEMIPFLNGATAAVDTKIFDGSREISFKNEWVLPKSGAVFMISPFDEQ